MITYDELDKAIHLQTDNTSYVIRLYPTGHVGHVYYGPRLEQQVVKNTLAPKFDIEVGGQVIYEESDKTFNLNLAFLEVSTYGKGDFRDPMLHFRLADGSRLTDFKYKEHEITSGKPRFPGMPETRIGNDSDIQTLRLTVSDSVQGLETDLFYTVFPAIDVITRRAVIRNLDLQDITIEKALSFNLDLLNHDYELISLDGAWIRERNITSRKLEKGIYKLDSKKGVSSSDHNPFIVVKAANTDETMGNCYGFSLIYSGNFEATAEISPHDLVRVMMGINSFDFYWPLAKRGEFVTPEAVLSFSASGLNRLSQNYHELINKHLIKPDWQEKERPVLLNNWEATYFDFNEHKLMRLARQAKKMGIELFVLDDGWFGKRNDDTSSLGDWHVNRRKLPSGLDGLAKKLHRVGLDFGIWVEPEMVNPDSDLFRNHPDWAISHPLIAPSLGRNQLILDLTNPEVRDHLVKVLSDLFDSANIVYCKWDMNRNFSDLYSRYLPKAEQGTFFHRYTLGLYDILELITNEFPEILFEGCASGGNRFDMGILYYMPQIWTSDDTDGYERTKIQYGTSYAYPQASMGAHVSHTPNQQTIRKTPLETRFNTAAFGLLGYELDLTRLTAYEKKVIKKQIAFYKEHRKLFQFGKLFRLKNPFLGGDVSLMVVSKDGSEAILSITEGLSRPNQGPEILPVYGLDPDRNYHVSSREQYFNLSQFGDLIHHALPIRLRASGTLFHLLENRYLMKAETENQTVPGAVLLNHGFIPKQKFIGTGYNESVRLMGDFGSRLYYFHSEEAS